MKQLLCSSASPAGSRETDRMSSYVIIVNWNGWKDTIECLESVFQINCPDFRVVVCDNASTNGSLDRIKAWARGELLAEAANPELSRLTSPPIPKPIPYLELTHEQAESNAACPNVPLILIQNEANCGFAAGSNVCIRYALGDTNSKYFWLLNNDTVVEKTALSELLAKTLTDPYVGAVGSICYFADAPSTVQSWAGAHMSLWTGYTRGTTAPRSDGWFHALYGASLLITRTALEDVGLLDPGFFMYLDETDFCIRLRKKGWRLAAAPDSRVMHKVNASTKGNSLIRDQYYTTSVLRILRLHSPAPRLAMSLFLMARFARRLLWLKFSSCRSVWAGIHDYRRHLDAPE